MSSSARRRCPGSGSGRRRSGGSSTGRSTPSGRTRSRSPNGRDAAVAVVCDGVGSLDRSDYAAALVSQRLASSRGRDALAGGVRGGQREAGQGGRRVGGDRLGAMATTALAVSVSRRAGWWLGEVAWVGDSPLWHLGDDGAWRPIQPAGEGEAGASTPAPCGRCRRRDGACSWCSFRIHGGALFAMSDGVGNPLAWSAEVRDTLAHWWARPPDPLTFAAQVGFARKSHMDDRTVVGIWPDGE